MKCPPPTNDFHYEVFTLIFIMETPKLLNWHLYIEPFPKRSLSHRGSMIRKYDVFLMIHVTWIYRTVQWRHNERDGVSDQRSPVLFVQPFAQAQIKESIKALRHRPLWGESTGDRWIPLTKGQWRGKCIHWWRHHDRVLTDQQINQ